MLTLTLGEKTILKKKLVRGILQILLIFYLQIYLFFIFLVVPHGLQDLSSLTRPPQPRSGTAMS